MVYLIKRVGVLITLGLYVQPQCRATPSNVSLGNHAISVEQSVSLVDDLTPSLKSALRGIIGGLRDQFGTGQSDLIGVPKPRNGILLIPGIAGSGLYASLDHAYLPACSQSALTAARSRIWASVSQLLPPASRQQCWAQKLSLDWAAPPECGCGPLYVACQRFSEALEYWVPWAWPALRKKCGLTPECEPRYLPIPGIEVQVDTPGGTRGFDYLDYMEGIGVPGTRYFHDLIVGFKALGFAEGDTLLGHPFDWRYPVWQLELDSLRTTIENFVERHPGQRITLVAHSLGSVLTTYFLNKVVTQEWKEKHINSFISMAGAFGGSHKVVRALLSGYGDATTLDFLGIVNISLFPPLLLRDVHRTFGSMFALAPNPHVFSPSTVIITIDSSHSDPPVLPTATPDPPATSSACFTTTSYSTFTVLGCPLDRAFLKCLALWGWRRLWPGSSSDGFNETARTLDLLEPFLYGLPLKSDEGASSAEGALALNGSAPKPLRSFGEEEAKNLHTVTYCAGQQESAIRALAASDEPSVTGYDSATQSGSLRRRKSGIDTYTLQTWHSLLSGSLREKAVQAETRLSTDSAAISDPGVPVYCLWSRYDFPNTEVGYLYHNTDLDRQPTIIYGAGDTSLTVEAASVCKQWPSTVIAREFRNLGHMRILQDANFVRFVTSIAADISMEGTGSDVSTENSPLATGSTDEIKEAPSALLAQVPMQQQETESLVVVG